METACPQAVERNYAALGGARARRLQSNKIAFREIGDERVIHIKPIRHRGASVQAKWLGRIHQDKAMFAREQFMDLAKPGPAFVLRHVVQFEQQKFRFP